MHIASSSIIWLSYVAYLYFKILYFIILKYFITTRLTSKKALKKITIRLIPTRTEIEYSIIKPQKLCSSLFLANSEKSTVKKKMKLENTILNISNRLSKNLIKGYVRPRYIICIKFKRKIIWICKTS